MKKALFLLSALLISSFVFSQAPGAFKYQAVVRDNSGNPITEQNVGFQIDILKGSTDGSSVYTETHSENTNSLGLVKLEIGNGSTTDDFEVINWGEDTYFLQVSMDIAGGTAYELMGTTQLLSVPYALHSRTADSISGGVSETDPVFSASVASGITEDDTLRWNNKLDSNDGSSFIVTFSAGISDAEAALKIANEAGANTKYIWVNNTTQLTTLDLTGVTELVELNVINNHMLSSLLIPDLKNCVNITIHDNKALASVNTNSLITSNKMSIRDNETLSDIDLSNLEFTSGIYLTNCDITSLDLPKLKQGLEIDINDSPSLISINLNVLESSDRISVQNSGINTLYFPLLSYVSYLYLSNCTSLSSLDPGNLESGNQIEIHRIASTALSFPKLKTSSSLSVNSCSALTSLDIPSIDTVGYFSVASCPITSIGLSNLKSAENISLWGCPSLLSIDIPNVETINTFEVHSCPSVSISLSNLKSLNNMTLQECSSLSSVNFENLETVSEQLSISSCGITSIAFPKLISIYNFLIAACPSLSSVDVPSLASFAGFDISYCALTSESVNGLLAHFVSISPSITGAFIALVENTPPAPPTGQGITDKSTLEANGNSVVTD